MKDCIKIATVSKVDYENACVDVLLEDEEDSTCFDVMILDSEYDMPHINDQVLVLFLPDDTTQGIVIGCPFCSTNKPRVHGAGIYHKAMQGVDVTASKAGLKIKGDLTIAGNVEINGNVTVKGKIITEE